MKIKHKISMLLSAAITLTTIDAFAEGAFLCMRSSETIAITADNEGNYEYIEMRASNGTDVYPQISSDGNTYLPLRYICEKAGLKDGSEVDGELPEGYFRYKISEETNKPQIEIKYNGAYYCNTIDEEFTYAVSDDDIRTVAIYNIDGSLYAPMTYIAKITNANAVWQRDLGQIMFISNSLNPAEYIDSNNRLIRTKEMWLGFDYFSNNIGNSSLYLRSDGRTISDLSQETGVAAGAKSITRSGNRIYYINNNKRVYVKTEDKADEEELPFYNNYDEKLNIYADTAIVIQNKLYGVEYYPEAGTSGRLFRSNLDGTGFEYMTEIPVYNLILKKNQLDYFLFYCEAENKAVIHMIRLKTMDDYTVEITDHNRMNMLENINQFAVSKYNVFYVDNNGLMHVIDINFRIEDIEIQRLDSDRHKTFCWAENGDNIENPDSMNYDYNNNVLYIEKNGKVYYYTNSIGTFRLLYENEGDIEQFSLISDIAYCDCFAGVSNNTVFLQKLKYSNGTVVLENIGG